jgi:hypothetical protein
MKKLIILFLLFGVFACTDLEEELREDISGQTVLDEGLIQTDALLEAAYDGLRLPFQDQSRFWAAAEHTGDQCLGPTRGPDWDDNGIWRVLHNHTWDETHSFLASTFSELLQVVFATTNILNFEPTEQQEAEARFIRAYVMTCVLDGWGQVPFREAGESLLGDATVLQPAEAVDFILNELDEIIVNLPDGPATIANKDAARTLRMKVLLNKGAFITKENPTFDMQDMQEVSALADEIMGSGKYSLATNYFDNFAPDNDAISTENIWTAENQGGANSGNVRSRWMCTLHYNQNPSGWNGFTTLGSFYDSFEEGDIRRSSDYTGVTDVSGIQTGLLLGQQFDQDGNALEDRRGNPLAFTKNIALQENGDNLEVTGIRVVKYPIDYVNIENADNDYVYFRLADVMLMKAEAELRMGNSGTALGIVNEIRTSRSASELASIDLDILLAERGRELYWEGHRRTDLIRFGRFLDAWEEKPASGPERLLFPIPAQSLAGNPNLVQNPGY